MKLTTLNDLLLTDSNGEKSRIVGVRGAESGLDYLEISTQSKYEKDNGIKKVHKVYTTEEIDGGS
jgi:hypothetical protein